MQKCFILHSFEDTDLQVVSPLFESRSFSLGHEYPWGRNDFFEGVKGTSLSNMHHFVVQGVDCLCLTEPTGHCFDVQYTQPTLLVH